MKNSVGKDDRSGTKRKILFGDAFYENILKACRFALSSSCFFKTNQIRCWLMQLKIVLKAAIILHLNFCLKSLTGLLQFTIYSTSNPVHTYILIEFCYRF